MDVQLPTIDPDVLKGDPRRHRRESIIRSLFTSTALVSVVVSVAIVATLLLNGWEFLVNVEWSSTLLPQWNPRQGSYGVIPLVTGSLLVTGVALLVAVPVGLAAAIYLSEYARPRVRRVLKPVLEILAGIPSVVVGYFALTWISPNLLNRAQGNFLAAGIGVGILIIPLIASVSEDAMAAVPKALREASAGLGARKMTTVIRVVLPAAISGLVASFILAASRAIGETMVVFIAGGAADTSVMTWDPLDGGLTVTAAMASLARGTDQVKGEALTIPSLYFLGILLFVITMLLNLAAGRVVRRYRQRY